ncbi:hypothetical protein [Brevibacillus porteri]|uniref:hypothetical protein n=1 Tax=Brevibacillus porteri TaxID=2126350 RepID=UPI00363E213C
MSDIKKLKSLLDEFGVGYRTIQKETKEYIVLDSGEKKINGYLDFYAEFEFDHDGKFVQIGIYE